MVLHVVLLVSSESYQWVRMHWLGLRLFGAMVWKLLIIEAFLQWKLNTNKNENHIGIWGCSWCCWKAVDESDLIEFISQFSELRCERYWFLNGFCCWKFKQIAKKWVGKEKSAEASMRSHCQISNFSILKMWKKKEEVYIWANKTIYTSKNDKIRGYE
jgi:hypothetical protein